MRRGYPGVIGLCLCTWQAAAVAVDDAQLNTIRRLGELNGVALHCKALDETQRMKRALVLNLPKRRQLGELFDHETNNSFMRFIEEGASCPSPAALNSQIDSAIEALEAAFGPE